MPHHTRFHVRLASGLGALELATELLHRARLADPRGGVWEAADLQWWWRMPRRSDALEQRFWLDAEGPVAAVLLTDWGRAWGVDPISIPGLPASLRATAWSAAMARLDESQLGDVETLARDDDEDLLRLLRSSGFQATEGLEGECWMAAAARPPVPALPDGFTLLDRDATQDRPHPMTGRNGPAVAARLKEVPLYDPWLDLALLAPTGDVAAYGLFWHDPITSVGYVEPMRTEAAWQRRGLARALLAIGLDRLAQRGARRFKVGFRSEAARDLYVGAGFEVGAGMRTWVRGRSEAA
jgi:GNAT superfamily N-acetyltransferase